MHQLRAACGPAQSIVQAGASKDFNHSILFADSIMFWPFFSIVLIFFLCKIQYVFSQEHH